MSERTVDGATGSERRRRVGPMRLAAAGLGAGLLGLVLVGCGGGSSSSDSTTTTVMSQSSSTTRATTSTTTSASGAARGSSVTVAPTAGPDGFSPWDVSAGALKITEGSRYSFVCPPNGQLGATVWGVGPYTDDSAICPAAVHAGLITVAGGGTVTFDVQAGASSYQGSTANGVTTRDYGSWPAQYQFVR